MRPGPIRFSAAQVLAGIGLRCYKEELSARSSQISPTLPALRCSHAFDAGAATYPRTRIEPKTLDMQLAFCQNLGMSAEPRDAPSLVLKNESLEISISESSNSEYRVARDDVNSFPIGAIHAALIAASEHVYGKLQGLSCMNLEELSSNYYSSIQMTLMVNPTSELDEDWPYGSLTFDLIDEDRTCLCICLYQNRLRDLDLGRRIVEEALSRRGFDLVSCTLIDTDGPDTFPYWSIVMIPSLESLVGNAFELRDLLEFLFANPTDGRNSKIVLDWHQARRALTAGFPSYLLGQEESSWLEVKSRAYEPGPAGEIELSQDVARFANGDGPGLLVIGFREVNKGSAKIIGAMTPVSVRAGISAIYHKIIDRRVYPLVRGLEIDEVSVTGGTIIVIVIPDQKEQDKPFLVLGAMIEGICEGAFISIVRRRGEHSIPITPAAIHAALSAGRAVINGQG